MNQSDVSLLVQGKAGANNYPDPLWEQIKAEARNALDVEPEAGSQIYLAILSQPSLIHALTQIVCNEISTPFMQATELRNLFLDLLSEEDDLSIHMDVMAVTMRSGSYSNALIAVLFNKGLHTLLCHRLSHRLWLSGRRSLAHYMQSTVSSKYSADIHPAATIGSGIFINAGAGIVIGETAVIGNDVSILQGVTLGGTGKERGDRHPKVGNGVILQDSCTVLGNIKVGDGAVITAKSIVTKEVPPLARVSGIPAKVKSYRESINDEYFATGSNANVEINSLEQHLRFKYFNKWQSATSADPSKEDQ
eukprot:CAMPEP_0178976354 /NCGR_PEP_ID=MMETSP0789-20121207/23780_1 /TAXON_ID=3005 /ORGANISM="Rhizosolenia setigera, Strain CCMP 1694" /LENGTH=305 /DNA_ID=CAMNT_0020665419 /DNA_START=270 /DNA_END=1187 /DNA_ORIENTATION=-